MENISTNLIKEMHEIIKIVSDELILLVFGEFGHIDRFEHNLKIDGLGPYGEIFHNID